MLADAPAHGLAKQKGDESKSSESRDLRMKFSSMRVARVEDLINATTLHSQSRSAIIIVDAACAMKLLHLIASHATTSLFLIDVRSVMRLPLDFNLRSSS